MKKQDFLKMVMDELIAIKTNATVKEISKLNIEYFDHLKTSGCIYGQMTGNCFSKRSKELHPKSFNSIGGGLDTDYNIFRKQSFIPGNTFTHLEKYLFMVRLSMHKKIIKFLKGEIDTIILK